MTRSPLRAGDRVCGQSCRMPVTEYHQAGRSPPAVRRVAGLTFDSVQEPSRPGPSRDRQLMLVWDPAGSGGGPGSRRPCGGRPSALTGGGAPPATSIDVHLAGLTNVMRQVGIARHGRRRAHRARRGRRRRCGGAAWRDRAEAIVEQLRDYRLVRPNGGWPLLADTARLGLSPAEGSARLFARPGPRHPRWPAGARPANATCG